MRAIEIVEWTLARYGAPDYVRHEIVRTVREAARPYSPLILVWGRFFLECPECVGEIGGDATAQDGRRAVVRVSSLLPPTGLR